MTERTTQLNFSHLLIIPVVMDFKGGNLTTDSGALLLRQLDERLGFTRQLSSCVSEKRDPQRVCHHLIEQIRQRVHQIACGYEDANDADELRSDPALKMTEEHRKTLEAWVRAKTTPQRTLLRARICLLAAKGQSNNAIAQELKTSRPTVLLWRARFAKRGPSGLAEDAPHGPSKKALSAELGEGDRGCHVAYEAS